MNRAWNLDLTKIFTDYNNDELTYTVSMDGGEEETVEGTGYSFTPDAVASIRSSSPRRARHPSCAPFTL